MVVHGQAMRRQCALEHRVRSKAIRLFRHLMMRVPPPLLFVLVFLIGVGLQHLVPITIRSAAVRSYAHPIGSALVLAGLVLALTCVVIFLASRTTIVPFSSASRLVTRGPYRLTRNPMYVSLVLVYLGVAAIFLELWPLLLLVLPISIIQAIVIPFEEARLRELFGQAFEQYCAHVPRWI
jgi:protein-S-isoprenylcysteine O-methyltransferase Ste14